MIQLSEVRPRSEQPIHQIPELIRQVHSALDELQALVPRPFTVEGRLDESIGEALAAYAYGLELSRNRSGVSSAITQVGTRVQLKVTRSKKGTIGIWDNPALLLVLQLSGREVVELYNGPTNVPSENAGRTKGNGERRIPVSRLKILADQIPAELKLQPRRAKASVDA